MISGRDESTTLEWLENGSRDVKVTDQVHLLTISSKDTHKVEPSLLSRPLRRSDGSPLRPRSVEDETSEL